MWQSFLRAAVALCGVWRCLAGVVDVASQSVYRSPESCVRVDPVIYYPFTNGCACVCGTESTLAEFVPRSQSETSISPSRVRSPCISLISLDKSQNTCVDRGSNQLSSISHCRKD